MNHNIKKRKRSSTFYRKVKLMSERNSQNPEEDLEIGSHNNIEIPLKADGGNRADLSKSHDSILIDTDTPSHSNEYTDFQVQSSIIINNDLPISTVDVRLENTINNEISTWALEENICQSSLNKLLKILKPYHPTLPLDSRTLLRTPRQLSLRSVKPGQYFHFGLEKAVKSLLLKSNKVFEKIDICINVDGLPISKSSNSELYPILVSLFPPNNNVAAVGIYHGHGKPDDANDFLAEFVEETITLCNNGLLVYGRLIPSQLKAFICDAPAKAFVKYINGHTGYFSCSKCCQEGEYLNTICFPELKFTPRTDENFVEQTNEEHHTGTSILCNIPNFGMITGFPLDYMHLVCLGVVKKLLTIWCIKQPPNKLSAQQLRDLSQNLCSQKMNIPVEFARKPRSLDELKRWKAVEFRQFLFYTGPIVLKGILNRKQYQNFLCLHIGCFILATPNANEGLLQYAETILTYFVKTFSRIYGPHLISHNVHNVLHLTNDVRLFGSLDRFSAFPFENYMKTIKKGIRTSAKPLAQLAKRFAELDNLSFCQLDNDKKKGYYGVAKEHNDGPLLQNCCSPQYSELRKSFLLTRTYPNNICKLKNNQLIGIKNFATCSGELVVIGQQFSEASDFYVTPCKSSLLGIYQTKNLQERLDYWHINEIETKCCALEIQTGQYVVIPLLHINSS